MNESSPGLMKQSPDALASRLMQKAQNQDGLPEIAIGLVFLTVAVTMWMQVAFHPGSLPYRAASLVLGLLVPALILGSLWAIKQVRRRFLIGKVGYVELKPLNRRRAGMAMGFAFAVAVVAAIAASKGSFPPASWVLAGTGIGGGLLAALSGRIPRFVVGGVVIAVTGLLLAFSRVSLDVGFMILYGSMGVLSLVSGCTVLLLFLRKPDAAGENELG
jgi:hypothetical protein